MNQLNRIWFLAISILIYQSSFSQTDADTSSLLNDSATLSTCIDYAIAHQPVVKQSLIDEQITAQEIRSRLADWYPQVNFNYSLQHNFQLQTSIFGGNAVQIGVANVSAAQFGLSQNIFNRDVLLASRSRRDVMTQARQNTSGNKIDVAVNVSKAFYEVLAYMQQIRIAEEDILRLERSLKDATSQYNAGISDKTDYKRATIALNNTRAAKKGSEAQFKASMEYMKFLMGYPPDSPLRIRYDSLQMEREVNLDTIQTLDYSSRIEYNQLQTQKRLQEANVKYQKWSFLPTISANGGYFMNFLNDDIGKLYNVNFPNSFAALTLSFPIFQGGKRTANIKGAEWQLVRTNWDLINLKNSVNAEYDKALAAYKVNLANYLALKENLGLAQEVYDVIQLQYRNGIKTYLEVITSETELRTSRINYINALYQLLSSKIDVQRALGQIIY